MLISDTHHYRFALNLSQFFCILWMHCNALSVPLFNKERWCCRPPIKVTTRSCHCDHSSVADVVTAAALEAHLARGAQGHLEAPPGGNDGGASYRSSSAGDVTWSRGAVARAVMTRGRPSPSSRLLRVSSLVYVPWRVGFGTRFSPATKRKFC